MRGSAWFSVVLGVSLLAWVGCSRGSSAPEPRRPAGSDIFLPADTEIFESRVPRNGTLAGILHGYGFADDLVHGVVEAAREVFDPRRIRAEHPYRVVRTLDGWLRRFEYEIDADRFLRIAHLPGDASGAFEVEVVEIEKESVVASAEGLIDERRTSLVAAMDATGETMLLALSMADIFSGEIDFNSDLRRGDGFGVVFERFERGGDFAGYGDVYAAWFRNADRTIQAYRFQVPGEEPGYYDDEGRSLKRFFLKSPLPFTPRITSRFSHSRLHPVHGTRRPHLGVDYAAPTGTPVVAVATGTVVAAGWAGEAGRRVRLRHASGYETYYLHLSSIANGIRPGARVAQGQMIGRVGMTGTATGPHLDYRVARGGTFVDPVAEHRRLPPGDPIPTEYLGVFIEARDAIRSRLGVPEADLLSDSLIAN